MPRLMKIQMSGADVYWTMKMTGLSWKLLKLLQQAQCFPREQNPLLLADWLNRPEEVLPA